MIALDQEKLCFVCVPKNGTHTIYNHLLIYNGRRVGKYHEFRWRKIPRGSFGFKRYKTVMVWRDPVDRAVSLYKDIVLREYQNKRKVVNKNSQIIHKAIAERCSGLSEFVDYLCEDDETVSNYLFKSQAWWFKKVRPDLIIKIENLDLYLHDLTGKSPSVEHKSADLNVESLILYDQDRRNILDIWARNDSDFEPL